MNNYKDYLSSLLDNIHNLTHKEFEINNFKLEDKKITIKDIFNRRDRQDINKIKYNLYKKKQYKINKTKLLNNNRNIVYEVKEEEENNDIKEIDEKRQEEINKLNENIDILSDTGLFNVIDDKSKLIKWKDIKNEDKKNKLNKYILDKYKDFPDELMTKIYELIDNNKINFKKYILYNEYTQEIESTPIINYKNKVYKLNYSATKIKKKKLHFLKNIFYEQDYHILQIVLFEDIP